MTGQAVLPFLGLEFKFLVVGVARTLTPVLKPETWWESTGSARMTLFVQKMTGDIVSIFLLM